MGCYRTGTSAVAGILHHLGVNMGKGFQEPNHANPKGYFEDSEFLAVNAKIYEAVNLMEHIDRRIGMFESKEEFHALCRQREIKSAQPQCRPIWGFKDPRFCVIAKHVVLPPDAKIIWIHRDIDETAMSIIKSLGLHGKDANMNKWRNFVEHYRNEVTNYMAGFDALRTLDINLPDLLTAPRTHINEIANFIGIDHNIPNQHTYNEHLTFEKIRKAYEFMEA
jgi:hypothetical protein